MFFLKQIERLKAVFLFLLYVFCYLILSSIFFLNIERWFEDYIKTCCDSYGNDINCMKSVRRNTYMYYRIYTKTIRKIDNTKIQNGINYSETNGIQKCASNSTTATYFILTI